MINFLFCLLGFQFLIRMREYARTCIIYSVIHPRAREGIPVECHVCLVREKARLG
jgi:hypothetical protein